PLFRSSNCAGLITSCMAALSTILSSEAIWPWYSAAMCFAVSRNSPDVALRMLALCTIVTFLRPWRRAYSNAYRTIRRQPSRVITEVAWASAFGSFPTLNVRSNPTYRPCVLAHDDQVHVDVASARHDRF